MSGATTEIIVWPRRVIRRSVRHRVVRLGDNGRALVILVQVMFYGAAADRFVPLQAPLATPWARSHAQ